jgi:ribonuclease HI
MKQIIAYTDGSAVVSGANKGKGGFGTYFPDLFGKRVAYSQGFKVALTGQMEVLALLHAIQAMPLRSSEPIELKIYSDSEYVVKSFTENRLLKWEAAGWINSSGEVKNKMLWQEILSSLKAREYLKLTMEWIKSHQVEKCKVPYEKEQLLKDPNIIGNMMADKLADYKRHKFLFPNIYQRKNEEK